MAVSRTRRPRSQACLRAKTLREAPPSPGASAARVPAAPGSGPRPWAFSIHPPWVLRLGKRWGEAAPHNTAPVAERPPRCVREWRWRDLSPVRCPPWGLVSCSTVPLGAGEGLPGLGAGHLRAPVLPACTVGPGGPAAHPAQTEAAGQASEAARRWGGGGAAEGGAGVAGRALPVPEPDHASTHSPDPRPVVVAPDTVAPSRPARGTAQLRHCSPRTSPDGGQPTVCLLGPAAGGQALYPATPRANNGGADSQASGRGASGKAQPHPTAEGSRATRVWEPAGRAGLQGKADCALCHEAPPHRSPFLHLEPRSHGEGLVRLHVMGTLGDVGPSRPTFGPPNAENRHRSTAHPALKGQGAAARKPAARRPLPRLGSEALPFIL